MGSSCDDIAVSSIGAEGVVSRRPGGQVGLISKQPGYTNLLGEAQVKAREMLLTRGKTHRSPKRIN